ncbi:TetR/AcrR family transcriptional regulator [Paraherbaspirillum soli]|uniref:TetR/AcrR family transcriptional regulator n=1 Tax=Paraherbaspirillum soli TaxID=631222 RepID=A0ABW0M3V4_9BURK
MKSENTPDHRTRVAAKRREKTRAKLLESALHVFSRKGPQAVIEDVIAQAGMARGSFYNYFHTNEELLEALANEINNELVRAIDPLVQRLANPVERVASGTRMLLHAITQFPQLGHFLSRLPLPTANSNRLGLRFLVRDVAAGISAQLFRHIEQRVAVDLVTGVVLSAAYALGSETLQHDYPEQSVRQMLQGLGVDGVEAQRIVALPLSVLMLPDSALLLRVQPDPA